MARATTKFTLNLRNINDIAKDIWEGLLRPLIELGQEIVAKAVRLSPHISGHNARSLGWAISKAGRATFGPISTNLGQSATGLRTKNISGLTLMVAGTSGYQGYLELGTRFQHAQPHILPAVEAAKKLFGRLFRNVL